MANTMEVIEVDASSRSDDSPSDPSSDVRGGGFALSEDDLDGVLAWTVIRVGRRMERLLADLLADYDLTPVQFGVLAQLEVHRSLTKAELARAIGIRAQSTRDVVTIMERRGLLARRGPGGRGRRTAIELSDDGHDLLRRTWPLIADPASSPHLNLRADRQASLNNRLHDLLGDQRSRPTT